MNIAVIGGGVAAHEAAVAARKTDPQAEIHIFSAEKLRPYRRPMLSGLLKGNAPDEKVFFIKPENFYAENRLDLHLDTIVESIGKDFITLADSSTFHFDKLIIASGGVARRPAVPSAPGALIFTLRSYLDLVKLNAFLPECRQVAVIGGGVLGLEIAESLVARGINTTVLECAPQLFPGRMTPEAAEELLKKLNAIEKLQIFCNASASGISRAGVICSSGMLIPADAVIFAAGSLACTSLAAEAGIAVNKGIIVDNKMQTSRENVFAAGDAAEFDGHPFGLYTDAMTTAKVAGTNAAGGGALFAPAGRTPVRLMAFGEKLVLP